MVYFNDICISLQHRLKSFDFIYRKQGLLYAYRCWTMYADEQPSWYYTPTISRPTFFFPYQHLKQSCFFYLLHMYITTTKYLVISLLYVLQLKWYKEYDDIKLDYMVFVVEQRKRIWYAAKIKLRLIDCRPLTCIALLAFAYTPFAIDHAEDIVRPTRSWGDTLKAVSDWWFDHAEFALACTRFYLNLTGHLLSTRFLLLASQMVELARCSERQQHMVLDIDFGQLSRSDLQALCLATSSCQCLTTISITCTNINKSARRDVVKAYSIDYQHGTIFVSACTLSSWLDSIRALKACITVDKLMDEVVSHLVYARCHDTNTFSQDQEMLRAFNWCFHFTGSRHQYDQWYFRTSAQTLICIVRQNQ